MSVKPITPDEMPQRIKEAIPDIVIEAVNELIVSRWDGTAAAFRQKVLTDIVSRKWEGRAPGQVLGVGCYNFTSIYEAAGWAVEKSSVQTGRFSYDTLFTFQRQP